MSLLINYYGAICVILSSHELTRIVFVAGLAPFGLILGVFGLLELIFGMCMAK
jgi:hypothetical protein